jgi:hypothetical protein
MNNFSNVVMMYRGTDGFYAKMKVWIGTGWQYYHLEVSEDCYNTYELWSLK